MYAFYRYWFRTPDGSCVCVFEREWSSGRRDDDDVDRETSTPPMTTSESGRAQALYARMSRARLAPAHGRTDRGGTAGSPCKTTQLTIVVSVHTRIDCRLGACARCRSVSHVVVVIVFSSCATPAISCAFVDKLAKRPKRSSGVRVRIEQ